MGSFARRLRRSKERAEYDKFGVAWRDEKRYQEYLIDGGTFVVNGKEGERVLKNEENGQSMPFLGKKPSRPQWRMVKKTADEARAARAEPDKVTVEDTDW